MVWCHHAALARVRRGRCGLGFSRGHSPGRRRRRPNGMGRHGWPAARLHDRERCL